MEKIKVVFAVCKAEELQKYLVMSNHDIETLGHITVLELLSECVEVGSVVVPHRNNEGAC